MDYHISTIVESKNFDEATQIVSEELKKEGFGVLTEIDIQDTLKKKIGVDFKKYKILGACNPQFAYKALTEENMIGVFLPCNVIVQEHENGDVEVSAVSPKASMMSVKNERLAGIAEEIEAKLKRVIEEVGK